MSVGNLNTEGGKKTNYVFQRNVLKGLNLPKLTNLTEVALEDTTTIGLRNAINIYFENNPNKYLINKEIILVSEKVTAFLTVATL